MALLVSGVLFGFTEIGIEIERLMLRGRRIMGGAVGWEIIG